MFKGATQVYAISVLSAAVVVGILVSIYLLLTQKRSDMVQRLKKINLTQVAEDDEILNKPFLERTVGSLAKWLVNTISRITPTRAMNAIEEKLEKAGNPRNLRPSDFLAIQGISGLTIGGLTWFLLAGSKFSTANLVLFTFVLSLLAVYLPWFFLATIATKRQKEIRRSLPDIMDLLVVSVEAGLAFDMALLKVTERFKGSVAQEFLRALREMQLGKGRKDALKDMATRVNLMELSSLVNAVIQSDQLGVGLGNVLRMQADLIREKRQQWIEEQAMKAPIKMLFPLVFFIFPCIFIIILGPAILNIMKALGG